RRSRLSSSFSRQPFRVRSTLPCPSIWKSRNAKWNCCLVRTNPNPLIWSAMFSPHSPSGSRNEGTVPSFPVDQLGQGRDAADQARNESHLAAMIFLVGDAVIHPRQTAAFFSIEARYPLQHVELARSSKFAFAFRVGALEELDHFGFL